MPDYIIVLSKNAQKQLDKLTGHVAEPILDAITGLEKNPRPQGYKKLKGRTGYIQDQGWKLPHYLRCF